MRRSERERKRQENLATQRKWRVVSEVGEIFGPALSYAPLLIHYSPSRGPAKLKSSITAAQTERHAAPDANDHDQQLPVLFLYLTRPLHQRYVAVQRGR